MPGKEIDRTDIYDWNNPTRDLSRYRWYNPLLWLFLLADLLVLLRWYLWHKRQSWTADRRTIHSNIVYGLQQCDFVLEDDDVSDHRKESVRETREHLERISDELNLQSDQLERYTDPEDESPSAEDGNHV